MLALGCGGEPRAETTPRAEVPATAPTAGGQGEWRVTPPEAEGAAPAGGPSAAAMPAASCPMLVPEVTVATSDVPGGASLTFTTTSAESVEDLRARVQNMASRVEARSERQGAGQGGPGQGGMHHGAGTPLPPSRAQVVDVEDGARIELRAVDPAEVDAVREHVREHGQQMRDGTCPMMRGRTPG